MEAALLSSLLLLCLGSALGGGPVYTASADIQPSSATASAGLTTQTVYGFLDFTTTIANTVMIFSPQSQAEIKPSKPAEVKSTVHISKQVEIRASPTVKISSEKAVSSKVSVSKQSAKAPQPKQTVLQSKSVSVSEQVKTDVRKKVSSSVNKGNVEVKQKENLIFDNNLEPSEQSDLAKQASGKVTETFKVLEVVSSKARNEPTGLVTKLGGTIVKDGVTTVHETSVIGTYISGKYAQVLKSSSHVISRPTKTHQILPKSRHLEPSVLEDSLPLEALFTTSAGQNLVRHSRRPAVSPPFKNKLQRTKVHEPSKVHETVEQKKKHTSRPSFKLSHNRFSRTSAVSVDIPTVSVFPETVAPTRRYRQRSASTSSTVSSNNIETGSRRFKPKPSPVTSESTTSLYKFKLARPQGRDGRWQYKTSPKPRVAIRRQDEDSASNIVQPTPSLATLPELEQSEYLSESDLAETTHTKPTPTLSIHTLRVDISTPANFSNTYYEIATVKSPYTFQVGTVKNTRYITLTTTLEKLLEEASPTSNTEPLTENILTTTPVYDKEAPIVTLPVINIAAGESLPLETMTDTFSTSETLLKTHLLPVVRDSNTTTLTLVQTYEVTKVVSATKTLPPTELFQFIPSKTLTEFNTRLDEAGSELHLELEFGDMDNNEEEHSVAVLPDNITTEQTITQQTPLTQQLQQQQLQQQQLQQQLQQQQLQQQQEQLTPDKLQQLAFLRLLNPNQAPVITSSTILSLQTLYESHVIPLFNGLSTVLSTVSRPVKTVTRTDYVTGTVPLPSLPLPFLPTPQLQPLVTSSPIVQQTIITQTDSKVLKLTFGAKTAYTTLYSTRVLPTLVTTYVTSQLPVQPTIPAFPQFFPPFNPFSFVG
ncbi:uncharacterized protein isoform X2 [Rhodnius prolixus]|uniref:uncharacterized protein isoform X2 n=1 Tax=Rhodnius prolixus TaxID=13249 RepID=UPI003D188422